MAQPLAQSNFSDDDAPDHSTDLGGIDAAGARLEQAFARLEAASIRASSGKHSLKADNEKLNDLLLAADEEIARLKTLANAVSERIDYTIATLEHGSFPLNS